ncbi:MAG: hypothetical protein NTZ09_14050 [Candidatus Hydrogenedentes bacterium]|nr:hypothetical protein [Candidatus Hydrogenedentota bacterium]
MALSGKRSAAILAGKFIVLAPICLVVWLLVLPVYAHILAYAAGSIFRYGFGLNVMGIRVDAAGFLNTDTSLTYTIMTTEKALPALGKLVCNIAPFVALVLATPRLKLVRRLRIIGIGTGLIFISHVAAVVIRLMGRGPVQGRTPLTTTVGFVSITLPFLLWIVLAYWGQLMAFLGDEPAAKPADKQADKPSA